jgi:hypothetical protein
MKRPAYSLIIALALMLECGCASPARKTVDTRYRDNNSSQPAVSFTENRPVKKHSWLRDMFESSLVETAKQQSYLH